MFAFLSAVGGSMCFISLFGASPVIRSVHAAPFNSCIRDGIPLPAVLRRILDWDPA
jgi:hypothetical protein